MNIKELKEYIKDLDGDIEIAVDYWSEGLENILDKYREGIKIINFKGKKVAILFEEGERL